MGLPFYKVVEGDVFSFSPKHKCNMQTSLPRAYNTGIDCTPTLQV
jgi:hypothetical protein